MDELLAVAIKVEKVFGEIKETSFEPLKDERDEETNTRESSIEWQIHALNETVATPLWPSVGVKPNTWKSWRLGVFRDSRMFMARQQGAKHLALGCSWCH